MNSRPEIICVVAFGDSLSDTGTAYSSFLMRCLSGVGKAPKDSFTNGSPWVDHFTAFQAAKFTINEFKQKRNLDSTGIVDAIIKKDPEILSIIHNAYNFKNHLAVDYQGQNFIRHYSKGGLTAHNYKQESFKGNVKLYLTRQALANLDGMREKMLADDGKYKISQERKEKTLIIEWSGGNDLITANEKPTEEAVDRAIAARINHVRELIKHGYRHFELFNLPNLSVTPLYQKQSTKDQQEANFWSAAFNDKLLRACWDLQEEHKTCTINVFDVNAELKLMHTFPEQYKLKSDLLAEPFVESKEFKQAKKNKENKKKHISPAKGFLFWDTIHPAADAHVVVGSKYYEESQKKFNFFPPKLQGVMTQEKPLEKRKDDFDCYPSSLSKRTL